MNYFIAQATEAAEKVKEIAKDTVTNTAGKIPPKESGWLERSKNFLETNGLNLLAAVAILIVGRWIAKFITGLVEKSMKKAKVEPTLITFVDRLVYIGLLAIVVIAALDKAGVPQASMLGVIGAAGLAVGLALQGGLSNFASGVLIIFFRPFKVGDLIEAADSLGHVRSIELFTSTIITLDNKTVIIPNSQLTSDKIVNLTETDELRMDLVFGTSYSSNIDKVKEICMDVLKAEEKVLKHPAPFVGVFEHGASSVNYAVRPWVKAENYWEVYFNVHEQIKKKFDENDIEIPFPQRDVHIYNVDKNSEG
ncbi:MAG: mechanosensitive ion channel [Lentisphaeraceae bacterium]|nr:mechanosensitive ion channel [Lentisphaeraceae bacterium]